MDPSQLKASYDQTQYLSDIIGKVDDNLLKSQSYQNVEALKSQNGQTKEILDVQDRAQYANENRQNRNFNLLNDSIKAEGGSSRDTVYRTSTHTNDNVSKGTADNLLTTERVGSTLNDNIYRTAMTIDEAVYRAQGATNDAVTAGRIEAQKNTNELIAYLKTNNDASWSNFGNVTKDIYQGKADTILSSTNQFASLAKQASDNTASIQLEGLKNKGDLSKQMAFQYSELKDKISCSEASIKSLLSTQEADRLRDALRATENKSLYFELKGNHHHHHGGHRRGHHH
jgi:hypothetical protein